MEVAVRQGESKAPLVRSSRYFAVGSRWYFSSRERTVLGPFESMGQATQSASDYIRDLDAHKRGSSVSYAYGMVLHDYETCDAGNCHQCAEITARMTRVN